MTIEDELTSAFDEYLRAYFLQRDFPKTSGLFHQAITCVGTGEDEIGFDPQAALELYDRDIAQVSQSIAVERLRVQAVPLGEETGLVLAHINITGQVAGQSFRMNGLRLSAVFVKTGDQWRLGHKHISLPTIVHEAGEAYPIKEMEERNRLLEEMVAEKTRELTEKNQALQQALLQVKTLRGLLPICSNCKKIRDDSGYWGQIEDYIRQHSEAEFSHSICPDCMKKLYPDLYDESRQDGEDCRDGRDGEA